MNYTKPMIDIVQELRGRLKTEFDVRIRISDPNLLNQISELFNRSSNSATKALIEELLTQAGGHWLRRKDTNNDDEAQKMYRGQAIIDDSYSGSQSPRTGKKIYRGQVISD